MRPIIEFCVSNYAHGTERVMLRLTQNPEYDVIEYGCLGNCGQCFDEPYALVNGEIISATSVDELYEAIIAAIENTEDEYAWFDEID